MTAGFDNALQRNNAQHPFFAATFGSDQREAELFFQGAARHAGEFRDGAIAMPIGAEQVP